MKRTQAEIKIDMKTAPYQKTQGEALQVEWTE